MLVMFSIAPFGKGESLSKYVAESIDIIEKSGLDNQTTPMGTIVEGSWDEIFALINKCRLKMRKSANRVSIKIWVDDRKGARGSLKKKIKSIEKHLGHSINK
ncbi:MAG: MTH1187 family thiamine-binding protein [bacterium]